MKFNYITKGIIPAIAVVLSLSSCLKDENVQQEFDDLKPLVGIADASPSGVRANSTSIGIVASDATASLNLQVAYFSSGNNPGVTVNIAIDEAILDEFPATYNMLDAGDYDFPSSVTIPAGEKTVVLPITLKPSVIVPASDPSAATKLYALPLKITTASGADISGNYGRHVVLVSIKNKYDGIYTYHGVFERYANGIIDPALPALSGSFEDFEADLVTIDANSVWFDTQYWADGSGIGGVGTPQVDGFIFTVDPITNKVTISNDANPAVVNTEGYDSRWDDASHTFYVKFQWGASAANRRVAEDTLVRTGARP
jgi:hypothetical protein